MAWKLNLQQKVNFLILQSYFFNPAYTDMHACQDMQNIINNKGFNVKPKSQMQGCLKSTWVI